MRPTAVSDSYTHNQWLPDAATPGFVLAGLWRDVDLGGGTSPPNGRLHGISTRLHHSRWRNKSVTMISRKTRVVMDDQEVVPIGVRNALESNGRVEIVAEGATEADALRLVNAHHPDVLLLSLNVLNNGKLAYRNLSAFDTIRRPVRSGQTKVLVLSRHGQIGLIHAIRAQE